MSKTTLYKREDGFMESVNDDRPTFSVIIGLYNHGKYLPQLIESLKEQTFQDFEVHFCDDGSNDGTREFFQADIPDVPLMQTWYYHRLWFKRGMRLAKNVNQGIKKARGKYCVFIMGDSFPEKNYLEILSQYVDYDSILCGVRVNIDGRKIIGMDWRLNKGRIPEHPALLIKDPYNDITGNGLVIPTDAMRAYGMWNEKIKGYGGDDNEIVARLYYRGYLVYSTPNAILYHNYHTSQADEEKNNTLVPNLIKHYGQ